MRHFGQKLYSEDVGSGRPGPPGGAGRGGAPRVRPDLRPLSAMDGSSRAEAPRQAAMNRLVHDRAAMARVLAREPT